MIWKGNGQVGIHVIQHEIWHLLLQDSLVILQDLKVHLLKAMHQRAKQWIHHLILAYLDRIISCDV
jgi:hypothetical protein